MSRSNNPIDLGESEPLPVVALDASSDAMPVIPIPVAASPRFCRTCGTAWQIEWVDCVQCTARISRAHAAPLSIAPEWRAMKSSLWLYFSLLAVCALGLGLSRAYGGVTLELWDTGLITAVTLVWCMASIKDILPPLRKSANVGWFALAIGLSLVTYAIAMGVIHGLNTVMHTPDESMSQPFLKDGYSWAAVVLFVCVQPAIIEELAFRGVIFAGISKALSGSETILVSAMMFMILHLAPARFPHTLALGVSAGYLRYRTKSIYPCMLMHFSHNLLCIAGEWLAR
jgi:membrane protease YdiL (CAAX protease family)